MTPPKLTFNNEELTLTLDGFGADWTLGQFGHLSLFDEASVQFPSSWTDLHIKVATQVLQLHWQMNAHIYLEQSLQAGISYSLRDGVSGQMAADTDLVAHVMQRPLVSVDALFTLKLEGEASRDGFSGSVYVGPTLRIRF
jgi:hypothetical protein